MYNFMLGRRLSAMPDFTGLNALTYLDLLRNLIPSVPVGSLVMMPELESLKLEYNIITEIAQVG